MRWPTKCYGTLAERFWPKVNKLGPDECWEWLAYTHPSGYGCLRFGSGVMGYAHRAAFILTHGEIPPGFVIDHICHNKSCVNPSHLRLATPTQNQANRIKKSGGRFKGVCYDPQRNLWRAVIAVSGKQKFLGRFTTPEEAHKAYVDHAKLIFGDFHHE